MLLKFFVGGAQLLLLHLQFLVELLGFFEQVLQTQSVQRAVDRGTYAARYQPDELGIAFAETSQKAHLNHAVDLAFVHDRHDKHVARCSLAQTRIDMEITGRQVVELQYAIFKGCLANQTFGAVKRLTGIFKVFSETVGRHALE